MRFTQTPRLLTAAALVTLPLFALPVSAQTGATTAASVEQVREYSIPAGSLDQVLNRFASEAGVLLAIDGQLTQGKTSPGLQGRFSVEKGFSELLSGSGLQVVNGAGGYTLQPLNSSMLPAVKVGAGTIAEQQDVVSYDRAAIEKLQPQDLKDLYKNESSVSVGGSIPINQKVYVRGVEETAMLVTVDGSRQNNKVFHHNATNLIDPALLKSVRAAAGVAPADAGPGAIGGSLAYETIDVGDMLASDDNFGGFLNGRYASNGDQITTSGSLYGRSGGFELLGYLNHVDGDNYEDGDGDEVPFTESALLSGLAKVAYEMQQGSRFELSHEVVNDDAVRPYRANFIGLTAGRPVPDSRNYDLTRENTIFNYNHNTGAGLWNPEVIVADNETELVTSENPLTAPATTITYTGISDSTSATLKNVFYTDFAEITAGADYYDDSVIFQYTGDPDIEEQAENLGVFVQLRQRVTDNLDLSYGLRYDTQDFTGTDGTDLDDSGVSGNLFGEYRINDYVAINAGYAEVWGGVVLAENFILNDAWDYSAGIEPVESSNYTVGVVVTVEGLIFEANSYQTDIENGRVPTWGGGPSLVADFEIEGYDLLVGYIAERGEITVKYSDIESDKDGEPASSYDGNYFTAPLGEIITVNGSLDLLNNKLTLGMNAEITLDNDALEDQGAKQDGYTVVDLYADYQVLESLALRVGIDNAFDEAYTDRASYGQEFPTVVTLQEPGRSFTFNARYTF